MRRGRGRFYLTSCGRFWGDLGVEDGYIRLVATILRGLLAEALAGDRAALRSLRQGWGYHLATLSGVDGDCWRRVVTDACADRRPGPG